MIKNPTIIVEEFLRLLTPGEISKLSITTKGERSVPLVVIMDAYQNGEDLNLDKISKDFYRKKDEADKGQGKISTKGPREEGRVAQGAKEKTSTVTYSCHKQAQALLAAYAGQCLEAEKNVLAPSVRKKRRPPKKQLSRFIMEEKKKLEEVNFKAKSQEIIRLYKDISKVNIDQQRLMKSDLAKSDLSGILLKKRI